MKPVKSSNISHIGYDNGKLKVLYKNGNTYEYDGVTPEAHEKLMSAESHGKHLHKMGIKGVKVEK